MQFFGAPQIAGAVRSTVLTLEIVMGEDFTTSGHQFSGHFEFKKCLRPYMKSVLFYLLS